MNTAQLTMVVFVTCRLYWFVLLCLCADWFDLVLGSRTLPSAAGVFLIRIGENYWGVVKNFVSEIFLDLAQLQNVGEPSRITAALLVVVDVVGQKFHFNEGLPLRMEVNAGVAPKIFDLVVKAFGQVGGSELGVNGGWIFYESQIVRHALLEMLNPGLIVGTQAIQ